MKGVCGFSIAGAISGPAAAPLDAAAELEEEEERQAVMIDGGEGEAEVAAAEEDLELGLSLGAKKVTAAAAGGGGGGRSAPWGEYCRILTAKDFPSLGSRASPRSSTTSSVSSSSPGVAAGGGGAGTKRTADSVASDVGGGGSTSPASQVVVGWPPIRAFRMNNLVSQSRDNFSDPDAAAAANKKKNHNCSSTKNEVNLGMISRFVKVNMDGDPIGRKVDLNAHQSYGSLALALEIMFDGPTYGGKASKLLDVSSEFALTYEDKDGDWMLVGDVPWGMFLDTVRRLRIMRTSDANGLAPRFQPSDEASG